MSGDDVVARLDRLAHDAARLSAEIGEGDRVGRLLAAFREEKLAVTHGGHRLLGAAGIGFAGPKPFTPDEVAVRAVDGTLELEPLDPLEWLAITYPVEPGRDVLVTAAVALAARGALAFQQRAKLADGTWIEGVRVRIEGGPELSATRLLRALPPVEGAARTAVHIVLMPVRAPVRLQLLGVAEVAAGR